jgi:ATP-binding cassette subfamily G (WHITE) protein 2 (PDR)
MEVGCPKKLRLPTNIAIRNIGIIIAFGVFLCAAHILATEFITEKKSKGEVLVFQREAFSKGFVKRGSDTESTREGSAVVRKERTRELPVMAKQTAIFHWENVCYEVKVKGETREILDHVDGWVKPGTLTALMVCPHLSSFFYLTTSI